MTTITDKLTQLSNRIDRTAASLAYLYGQDRDDLGQVIRLTIIQKADRDPAYLDQSDAYIVSLGAWRARDEIRKENRESRHAGADIPETDAGDEWALPANVNPWPDIERRLVLAGVAARLDADLRSVYDCLADGLGVIETAQALDIHRSTVTARRKRIARMFA